MSAETFRSVLGALRSQKRDGERRREPRVGVRATVELCVTRAGRTVRVSAHLRDMSSGGASLLAPIQLMPGERFIIELPQDDKSGKFQVQCEVRHARAVDTKNWRTGASFVT